MEHKTRHVVPNAEGGWSVRNGGAERASKLFETKSAAEKYAREKAKKVGGEVYIHHRDGRVAESASYASSPAMLKRK